ncbi:MAG: DUF2231 domain-containing protein [Myxococcota bacterium]
MSDIPLHAALVHLPLGLSIATPLLAGLGLAGWWRGLLPKNAFGLAVVAQGLLVVSAFAAMSTGEDEEEIVEAIVDHEIIHEHEEWAESFSYTSVLALALMGGAMAVRREDYARYTALGGIVVGVAATGLALVAGHEGGELVYAHGAARAYTDDLPAHTNHDAGGAR